VALLLSALEMESIGPDQISEEYCPKLEHRVVAGHVQRQREQLMTFLNGDAYELIEAGSKLIAKIVDSCGVKEENKISIEIMQTVQNNFLKPILEHIWAGWKVRSFQLIKKGNCIWSIMPHLHWEKLTGDMGDNLEIDQLTKYKNKIFLHLGR
jgi:hypothetical protein